MPRNVWSGKTQVYKSVGTLKSIYERGLGIPPELIESYKQKTRNSGSELVAEFYERLTTEAPELIEIFIKAGDNDADV